MFCVDCVNILRKVKKYIHQQSDWPQFKWDDSRLTALLASVRYQQGRLLGRMETLGFDLRAEATLNTLTLDILKSNEIEGEVLNAQQVRSSLARRLGVDIAGAIPTDRHVDGIVEMMLDATQRYLEPLTSDRLFGWHNCMFPTGRSGMYKISTGQWRTGAMQVVSGMMGAEKIHFEAPATELLAAEMNGFINWFNEENSTDPILKAGIAHLWFVTIHPFEDGNGRIGRAILDMQLTRADASPQRFYSLSAQIQKERNSYYDILEMTQRGDLNITAWLLWFLECTDRALAASNDILSAVLAKAVFWDKHRGTQLNPRQSIMVNKLLDGFTGKLTTDKWAKINKCSHDTALRDIADLIDKNILTKDAAGGRSTGYELIYS